MSTTELEPRPEGEIVPATTVDAKPKVSPALNNRVLSPLLLPLAAILFVALYTINLSRVFLAGGKNPAVFVAGSVTLVILIGAATISASRHARSLSLGLTVAGFVALIVMSGLLTLGESQEKKTATASFTAPTGPAVASTSVTAGPALAFNPNTITTKAGINEFDVTAAAGGHTFEIHEVPGFKLDLVKAGQYKGKVDLKAGTYHYFCAIPGHEAAGMKGTITVTAS